MSDRKLLELAAKAAGIKFHSYVENELIGRGINIGDLETPIWNPLDQDAAALRLSIALGIETIRSRRSRSIGRVIQAWYPQDGNPDRSASEKLTVHINGDRLAATRRAIVRAAAEIGRNMP